MRTQIEEYLIVIEILHELQFPEPGKSPHHLYQPLNNLTFTYYHRSLYIHATLVRHVEHEIIYIY